MLHALTDPLKVPHNSLNFQAMNQLIGGNFVFA